MVPLPGPAGADPVFRERSVKKIFIAFVLLALIAIGAVVTVKSMTSGLSATAEIFFTAVAKGDSEAAWTELSTAFRQEHPLAELKHYLAESGLDRYESAVWSATNYLGSSGELTGRVFTDTGAVVPVRLEFVRQEEGWRIHGLEAILPSLVVKTDENAVPDLASLEAMAEEAIHNLALALRMDDFGHFHAGVSALWQAASTADEIRASFAPFAGRGAELDDYSARKPVFNAAPRIDEQGVLRLEGSIPSESGVLRFDMGFVFEYPNWKLRGLRLSL